MRKASDNTELYIGLFSFCKRFKLPYYRVRYKAVKCRMRIFRFNGLLYIEVKNMKILLRSYETLFDGNVTQAIDYLNSIDI